MLYFYAGECLQDGTVFTRGQAHGYKSVRVCGTVNPGTMVEVAYENAEILIKAAEGEPADDSSWLFLTDELGFFENIPNECKVVFLDNEKMLCLITSGSVFFKVYGQVNMTVVNTNLSVKPNAQKVNWVSATSIRSMVLKDAWDYNFFLTIKGGIEMKRIKENGTQRSYPSDVFEVKKTFAKCVDLSLGWVAERDQREEVRQAKERERLEAQERLKRIRHAESLQRSEELARARAEKAAQEAAEKEARKGRKGKKKSEPAKPVDDGWSLAGEDEENEWYDD